MENSLRVQLFSTVGSIRLTMEILVLLFALILGVSDASLGVREPYDRPDYAGRWVNPTVGEIWPKPQVQQSSSNFHVLRPTSFRFEITGFRCDIIDDALSRYYDLIFYPGRTETSKRSPKTLENEPSFRGFLDTVQIELAKPCEEYPYLDMDEQYYLTIDSPDFPSIGRISSPSVWGILRGLESFSQLVYPSSDGIAYQINSTTISDFPRFSHRGILLDTARHFYSVKTLKKNLDLMAQNKMNVFHWHIVDEWAFPYESVKFPNMSRFGSFNEYSHVYTHTMIRDVIEYARLRGIRVLVEFDTPGHAWSWGNGVPGLLTECFGDDGMFDGSYGPINPAREENFVFLRELFDEIYQLFPEAYVHLGGDEVSFYCWSRNPEVQAFMQAQGFGTNYSLLEQYYMNRLISETQIVSQGKMKHVAWQEVVDNNVTLRGDTVVHLWKDEDNFASELARVTSFGYRTLLSSPWYLNFLHYGTDWDRYYIAEPLAFEGTEIQKKLVIGGEACMWSEFVDATNLIGRLWPRASAVAERLWSPREVNDPRAAAPRLEEHRCRMVKRGYSVQPSNGVGFCDVEWDD